MSEHVLVTFDAESKVATVSINNPATRNGITRDDCVALAYAIRGVQESARCIILTGQNDHFCSGADLRAAQELLDPKHLGDSPEAIADYVRNGFHQVILALNESSIPTLAVIHGACVGFGFDMATACDLRLASRNATFGQVFHRIGLVPDGGSSFFLPQLVGLGKAMELMLLAETFDGATALEVGLVNRAVDARELDAMAADWSQRLAATPPIAASLGRRNLRLGAAGGDLKAALDREALAQQQCLTSADFGRELEAFFRKAKPKFEGN